MASSFFFVDKKDGKLRPCQDYRYLNKGTIKNAYPLPLVQDLLDKLKGAKYFTKMDVRWGYNNICIREGDEYKAAFKTKWGLHEPTVMFYGLCNSPATFQNMMNNIFAKQIDGNIVIIYMDDILIFAKTKEELERYTREVLQVLKENDLYLKPEKCEFAKTEVDYLGMIIAEDQIKMDPKKLRGITEWPTPTTVKEVRSFLGFGNFYRRFIAHFSDLAFPLNNLLKKDSPFLWTEETERSFQELKKCFTSQPVLHMPDSTKPFQVEADTSKYASGGVLTQLDEEGKRHPVSFLSKTFSPAERNYQIYDQELLGIMRALEEWRHYLQGSPHPITILSDHQNLTYYRQPQRLNGRQARWLLLLSEYDFELQHLPGTKMIQSDALSRRTDHHPDDDPNEALVTMLPDKLFIRIIDHHLQENLTIPKDQQVVSDKDMEMIETTDGQRVAFVKNGKIIAPEKARLGIFKKYHDHPTAGHPGQQETYMKISTHYWWPGIRHDIRKYVEGWGKCQQFKINRMPSKPALQPIEGAKNTRPFSQVSMDLITDLPPINGKDSILSVVDHGLTKGVILIPCAKTITAEETANLLLDNLFKRFGLPDKIISDRGPNFAAQSIRELYELLEIDSPLSTAYHPQSDGTTERYNQEIIAYLSIVCTSFPTDWLKSLPILEFVHNSRRHSNRPYTPFEMIMGTTPKAIPLAFEHSKFPSNQERLENLERFRNEALSAHELARQRMAKRITSSFSPFKKGQKVWLDARNLKHTYNKKIAPRRKGPFEIKDVLGPVTYRLNLPKTWRIHNVFHAILLSSYKETDIHRPNYPQVTPELIDGEEEYEVERLINRWGKSNKRKYLVKWKDMPDSENLWKTIMNLKKHASEIVQEYNNLHPYKTKKRK